ncbi:hypothetical protein MASR1M65_20350 [Saprospiraceae bacterium]
MLRNTAQYVFIKAVTNKFAAPKLILNYELVSIIFGFFYRTEDNHEPHRHFPDVVFSGTSCW